MQELFGPPITLGCFPSRTATPTKEKSYKDTQISVHTQVKYDFSTCPVLQTLKNISPTFRLLISDGFTTTLTVTVPKNPRHSFWHQEVPLESPEFEDKVSFEVRRWGQTKEQSYNHAVQRAADIIRYIRATVLGDSTAFFQFTISSRNPISCSVFQLGIELYSMWKQSNEAFSRHLEQKHTGASRLLQAIQEKHDLDAYIYARPLLQYYKVSFPTLCVG
jgi:hypothetical protein